MEQVTSALDKSPGLQNGAGENEYFLNFRLEQWF